MKAFLIELAFACIYATCGFAIGYVVGATP